MNMLARVLISPMLGAANMNKSKNSRVFSTQTIIFKQKIMKPIE